MSNISSHYSAVRINVEVVELKLFINFHHNILFLDGVLSGGLPDQQEGGGGDRDIHHEAQPEERQGPRL